MNIFKTLPIVLILLFASCSQNDDCADEIAEINIKYNDYIQQALENQDLSQATLLEKERQIKLRDACN